MRGFSDTLAKTKQDIFKQFRSDELLVQERIDSLSRIVVRRTDKSQELKKVLEGILPDLIRE